MKSIELYKALKTFSDLMNGCGATQCAEVLEAGSALLLEWPDSKMADLCKKFQAASVVDRKGSGPGVDQYTNILKRMSGFLDAAAKPTIKNAIDMLASSLDSSGAEAIPDFVAAVKANLAPVQRSKSTGKGAKRTPKPERVPKTEAEILFLVCRLEGALGTSQFSAIYSEIKAKGYLAAAEAKTLCRKFTGTSAKKADDAFNLIWRRHQSLLDSDAMGEATKGHIAA